MKNDLMFQTNIRKSFHFVSEDVNKIAKEQQELRRRIEAVESTQRRILYSFANAPLTSLIGNLETKEIHREDCLLVTAIKNFDRIMFSNKFEAQQQGFRECLCLF